MRLRFYGGVMAAFLLFFAVLFAGGAEVAAQPTKTQPTKTMCRNTGSFEKWLSDFKREALQQGISQRTLSRTAHLLVLDQKVIGIDRGQRVFSQPFLEFANRMAGSGRTPRGQALIKKHAALFEKIEAQFGVPAPVIVAFW